MPDGIARIDRLSSEDVFAELLACCGSRRWAREMTDGRPFGSTERLYAVADEIWRSLPESDWLEAFASHPRIGDRSAAGGEAAAEQAGALAAPDAVASALVRANRDYEARFGRIFLVCASGRTAEELLSLCRERLHNDAPTEMRISAEEQRRITRLRLERLMQRP